MLTSDLLRVKAGRSVITPSFVDVNDDRRLEKASGVLALFEKAFREGWRRHEIDEEIRTMTQTEVDHKFTRGLSKLMIDRSKFSDSGSNLDADISATEFRRLVFSKAAMARLTGSFDREAVLSDVAKQLAINDPEDVLYGDLKEMQRISSLRSFDTSHDLLHRYNLALCQACLIHASAVVIEYYSPPAKWIRHAFRTMKFHGLLFEAHQSEDLLRIRLDGPQSLLRLSTKYGIKMANYLPNVLLQPGKWRLEAELRWGSKRKTARSLSLNSDMNLKSHYKPTGVWTSRAETLLLERFRALDSDWVVEEGQLILGKGQRIFVPDCRFTCGEKEAHLEIIGFWRKKSLKKHLNDMPKNMFLAVSKRLLGEKGAFSKDLDDRIIPFGEVISLPKLMAKLEVLNESKN